MKTATKFLLTSAIVALGTNGTVQAATILSTDFTGITTNDATNTVSNINWDTVAGVDTPASSLTIATIAGDDVSFFSSANLVKVGYNLKDNGPFSFTIEDLSLVGASAIDLTALSLDMDAITNNGGEQNQSRDLTVAVEVVGSISKSLGSYSTTISEPGKRTTGESPTTYEVDLGELVSLSDTETYDVVVTISSPGNLGVNAQFDTLRLTGDITAVPEPGSLGMGLLGLGGLCMAKRRRRA